MTTSTQTRTARPADYVEAWEVGVMNGHPSRAKSELQAHPAKIEDPTFNREGVGVDGWHRASEISSPSTIARMRSYLASKGAVPSTEVEAAWELSLHRADLRAAVEKRVQLAMRDAEEQITLTTDVSTYAWTVIEQLTRMFGEPSA